MKDAPDSQLLLYFATEMQRGLWGTVEFHVQLHVEVRISLISVRIRTSNL